MKKTLIIVLCVLLVLVLAAVTAVYLIPRSDVTKTPSDSTEETEEEQKEIIVPVISEDSDGEEEIPEISSDGTEEITETPSDGTEENEETVSDGTEQEDKDKQDKDEKEDVPEDITDIDPEDIITPTDPREEITEEKPKEAEPVTEPEKEKEPEEEETQDTENKEIVIGGGDTDSEEYSCGSPNHHCDGPETHAYICNLELKGCKYCGSHSCPSFYATDKWGDGKYTPSECPMYNAHNDPLHYCQTCGKKVGDGSNGTCVTFNTDIQCPLCGENVKAWECHTCQ